MTTRERQFCPKCGRQRQGDEKFCPNGATPFDGPAAAPAPATPPATKRKGGVGRTLRMGCLGLVALVVLIAVVLALGGGNKPPTPRQGSGSQGTPPQSAASAAAPVIGQPYASGNWEYTVHDVKRMKEIGSQFLKDTAKGEYVVVGVTLKNIGRQNFGISGHDFEIYDGGGIKYDTAVTLAGDQWAKANGYDGGVLTLTTGQMPPGVAVKYAVVFDVAPGAQGLRLRLVQPRTDVPLA